MQCAEQVWESRRTPVLSRHGAVSCDQPLAGQIGIDILKRGGNAADAAVAIAAALHVLQPQCCGLGGDAFCLYYDAASKTVKAVNGSGRAPAGLTLDRVEADGFGANNPFPMEHGHAVTVPGAAAALVDTFHTHGSGKVSLEQILKPAIELAEQGFPVSHISAYSWDKGSDKLRLAGNIHGADLLINGRAPRWGEVMRRPHIAQVFKEISQKGKAGFYEGWVAEAIVDVVQKFGGVMTTEDLARHVTTYEEPISVEYKGVRLWEIPPNGQGIVALMALNILEEFDLKAMGHNSGHYVHTVVEALRLSFADAATYCADPSMANVPISGMLDKNYATERRGLIKPDRMIAESVLGAGAPPAGRDTTYFTVVDGDGNACSFITSNFHGLGTGLVPKGCGFTLQNRGNNFSLERGHRNAVAPNKRPYHTIIPAMLTKADTGELLCSYGVMGGYMQPQGHVQVLLNMLEFGMNPQEALDKPRFLLGTGYSAAMDGVTVEEGMAGETMDELRRKGHAVFGPNTGHDRAVFGRGHVITKGAWFLGDERQDAVDDKTVLWAGSDPRIDGQAIGY